MPQFIAGFASFFTGAVAGATAAAKFAFFAGQVIFAASFNAALGAISRKLTSKKEERTGRNQPREITVRATDAYDVFVYGRALVGGVTVYHNAVPDSAAAQGVNNRMFHVVKWAGHPCASLSLIRLDDRELHPTSAAIDWNPQSLTGTGAVQGGEFRGSTTASGPTYFRWYLGHQAEADARVNTLVSEWTNSHIGHDQTYGVLEIQQVDAQDQTSKVYQKGFPSNIAAVLHGKKVFDPRKWALNADPHFLNTNSYWFEGAAQAAIVGPTANSVASGIGGALDFGLEIIASGGGQDKSFYTEAIPCHPGSKYTIRYARRGVAGSSGSIIDSVMFYTDAGSHIGAGETDATGWAAVFSHHHCEADYYPGYSWLDRAYTLGSGENASIPSSARFMRAGIWGVRSNAVAQFQDFAVYLGVGSRHLPHVASTWHYSESPPLCVADYLTDERLGFGRHLRIPINPSRYAKNADPTWRRLNSLNVTSYWRTGGTNSGTASGAISGVASLASVAGAPAGRRALVVVASGDSDDFGREFSTPMIPVDPSGQYVVSLRALQEDDNSVNLVSAVFLNSNGEYIASRINSSEGWVNPSSFWHDFLDGTPFASTWSHYVWGIGSGTGRVIPPSATHVRLRIGCCREPTSHTAVYLQEFMLSVGTQIRQYVEPHEQIYWPSVSSAASYCDELVATPSGTQVRFACNGAGHTGRSHRENIRDLLSSFNGRMVYTQSGFWISAGWDEPTKTLNKSDFRGPMKIRAQAERMDRFNHVRGTFFDPLANYKSVPFATVTADEYIARDNSEELFHDINLPFTNDWFMAQRVAFGILEQGDNQQLVEFQLKHSALDLLPGRTVGITHDVVSWTNHTLRMVDMRTDLKKGVRLFAKEDYQASYTDPSTSDYYARETTGVTSAAPIVPQVGSVQATYLGRDGVYLEWVNPSARAFEYVDIYRRLGTNAFSGSTLIKSTRANQYIDAVNSPGNAYYYWFRTRDFAGNVSSIFPGLTTSISAIPVVPQVSSVTATYLGRDGVELDWFNPPDRDFEFVDIYRRVGGTNAFSGSVLIKSTRDTQFLDAVNSPGSVYRYWFRTRDFAGNHSSVYPGLATSFSVTPNVPLVSSAQVISLGRDGALLRWVNPNPRDFEWIDIYRRGTTNAFSGSTLIKSTRNDEYLDPVSSLSLPLHYWFVTRDFAGNVSSPWPGLATSFTLTASVPFVSSVTITPRAGGIQLRWTNPDNRYFEWVDVYRHFVNAFSGTTSQLGPAVLIKSTRNDEFFDTNLPGRVYYYWFRTRDFAGNVSSPYPGLTSSFGASALFPVVNDPEYVFFEEFRYQTLAEFYENWHTNSDDPGSGVVSFPTSGIYGGQIITQSGDNYWLSRKRIPYDPLVMYQAAATVRQNSIDGWLSLGVVGFKSDGVTPVNVFGSEELFDGQHYFTAYQSNTNSIGQWQEFIGYLKGHSANPASGSVLSNQAKDSALAARLHSDARYMSPVFRLNGSGTAGLTELDHFWIRKIKKSGKGLVFDSEITDESNWIASFHPFLTSSYNFIDGPTPSFRTLELDGQYSMIRLPPDKNPISATSNMSMVIERLRPDFHTVMPLNNTVTMAYRALIYVVGSQTPQIAPVFFTRTLTGTWARPPNGVGPSGGFTITPVSYHNQWYMASGAAIFWPGDVNVTSHGPGPHYVSIGIGGVFASSWEIYVAAMDAEIVDIAKSD
jgi:hypothetical protein